MFYNKNKEYFLEETKEIEIYPCNLTDRIIESYITNRDGHRVSFIPVCTMHRESENRKGNAGVTIGNDRTISSSEKDVEERPKQAKSGDGQEIRYEDIPLSVRELAHKIYNRPHCTAVLEAFSGIKKGAEHNGEAV